MAKVQQDVVLYKEKPFSTAQTQLEKDLKKLQREGWRLVSVTPTKKVGFGCIAQLTAIYEKDVADNDGTGAATRSQQQAREQARIAEQKARAKAERLEKIKETQRLASESEGRLYAFSVSGNRSQPSSAPTARSGVNGNPWGYDFTPGNLIYSPPIHFCSYFACISNFWNGKGYVMECVDGLYSKSGGIRGSCSSHGGDWRPLYMH